MEQEVKSFDEIPQALTLLIKSLSQLTSKVENLQALFGEMEITRNSGRDEWMNIEQLCSYLPLHPKRQTVYGWVTKKQIPVHKVNNCLVFKKSEIDEWMLSKNNNRSNPFFSDARAYISP